MRLTWAYKIHRDLLGFFLAHLFYVYPQTFSYFFSFTLIPMRFSIHFEKKHVLLGAFFCFQDLFNLRFLGGFLLLN
jgi:hypothetical protein